MPLWYRYAKNSLLRRFVGQYVQHAMRANLTGFCLAHPQASQSELLNAMERATARIDKAVQKSNALLIQKDKVE
jgi:hypothetical protein